MSRETTERHAARCEDIRRTENNPLPPRHSNICRKEPFNPQKINFQGMKSVRYFLCEFDVGRTHAFAIVENVTGCAHSNERAHSLEKEEEEEKKERKKGNPTLSRGNSTKHVNAGAVLPANAQADI